MIKNFQEFLNESISVDDLVVFDQEEFDVAESSRAGEFILAFFENDECLLIDENGDEDEYKLHQWIVKIANDIEVEKIAISAVDNYSIIKKYTNFPVIEKLCLVGSGNSIDEADRNLENPMIFVPMDFDPQKFMHETRGRNMKNFGV